jgi:hypothetical protein
VIFTPPRAGQEFPRGRGRRSWDRLGEVAKDSWERNPTDRKTLAIAWVEMERDLHVEAPQRKYELRMARAGAPWRMLPNDRSAAVQRVVLAQYLSATYLNG